MEYQNILQVLVQMFIFAFAAWGLAGVFASLWNKRSTLQAWWSGSTYFGPRSSLRHHQFE